MNWYVELFRQVDVITLTTSSIWEHAFGEANPFIGISNTCSQVLVLRLRHELVQNSIRTDQF